MKIYTKTGDSGETDLIGQRVDKDNLRISTVGTLDEANSLLGIARSKCPLQNVAHAITYIQKSLFEIGAIIAGTKGDINVPDTKNMEDTIDLLDSSLPELKNFILPGGHEAAAFLHHARSVCRRAERLVVALSKKEEVDAKVLEFINRVSDFLFILARHVNHHYMLQETVWEGMGTHNETVDEIEEVVEDLKEEITSEAKEIASEKTDVQEAKSEDVTPEISKEEPKETAKKSEEIAPPVIETA